MVHLFYSTQKGENLLKNKKSGSKLYCPGAGVVRLISLQGEEAVKQQEHQRNGNGRNQETAQDILVGQGGVTPGPGYLDGDPGKGGNSALQEDDQGNIVGRLQQDQQADEEQREQKVFYRDKFDHFPGIDFPFLLEVDVKAAAQDNHDQR